MSAPKVQVYKALGSRKGFCAVIHGLNQKPQVMEELIAILQKQGVECHLLSLIGHRPGEWSEFQLIQAEPWKQEADQLVSEVMAQAQSEKLPYYLLGYSLGAVLQLGSLIRQEPAQMPERAFFFAPAVAVTRLSQMIKPWGRFVPWFPSLAPATLRAQARGCPGRAYHVLFQLIDELRRPWPERMTTLNATIVMDAKDELVSSAGVLRFIQNKHWTSASMLWVNLSKEVKGPFHHLITCSKFLPPHHWREIEEKMSIE